jgi:hypothetical protein|tara:strand:- start:3554 stop:4054 length:501 start_codon:yes stop_codon:yes gene_type:complete
MDNYNDIEKKAVDFTNTSELVLVGTASIPQEGTNVTLIRTAFNREAFDATINTKFTELGVAEEDLSFFDPNLATVEDFFNIYNNLFFIIPDLGETNSHEFLIKESSEKIEYQANQEEIQALLDEIAELRETNLQLQVDMAGILGAKKEIDRALVEANRFENVETTG